VRAIVWMALAYSAAVSARGQQLNVSICDVGGVRDSVVATAKTEAQWVFRSARVEIVWVDCDETDVAAARRTPTVFVIRLRTDITPRAAGTLSLEEMGRAFVSDDSRGYLADAYLPPIQGTAERYQADAGVLLGFVIAHELGHLILGAGHTPDGIMRARWEGKEVSALRQRWLRFNRSQANSIRSFLTRPDSKAPL
jgi:hypothetical protein